MSGGEGSAVAAAVAAACEGDLDGARLRLEAALESDPTPEALDALGTVLYLLGDYADALECRERAFARFRRARNNSAALRTAAWVAYVYGAVFGNGAACAGWLGRLRRVADAAGPCREQGWAALTLALFAPDAAERARHVTTAKEVAAEFNDLDQEFAALAFEGWTLVEDGQVDAGMASLDEAAAAATSGEVQDLDAISDIYCKMLVACETAPRRPTSRAVDRGG